MYQRQIATTCPVGATYRNMGSVSWVFVSLYKAEPQEKGEGNYVGDQGSIKLGKFLEWYNFVVECITQIDFLLNICLVLKET